MENMMRIAGRGEDGTAKALKTLNDGTLQTNAKGRDKTTFRLTFDGVSKKTVTSQVPFSTDRLNSQHLKNIEVYVVISSSTRPSIPIGVRLKGTVNNHLLNFSAYDWTNETWMVASFTEGKTSGQMYARLVATQPTQGFMLSTHPNFYWLNDFNGNTIQLEFVALEAVPELADITLDVYVTGDLV